MNVPVWVLLLVAFVAVAAALLVPPPRPRQRLGDGCDFCPLPATGNIRSHRRGRREAQVVRFCDRHMGEAVGRLER